MAFALDSPNGKSLELTLMFISVGAQPILGYNYGAGNIKRVKKTYGVMLAACFSVSGAAFVVFQCFPQRIVNIFGSESELYNEFAVKAIRTFLLMCIPIAYQVSSGFFIGKPLPSMLSALSRQLNVFVPAAVSTAYPCPRTARATPSPPPRPSWPC